MWMIKVIREVKMRNKYIIGNIRVASIVDTMRENRLILLEHVLRKKVRVVVKDIYIEVKNVKGRLKGG